MLDACGYQAFLIAYPRTIQSLGERSGAGPSARISDSAVWAINESPVSRSTKARKDDPDKLESARRVDASPLRQGTRLVYRVECDRGRASRVSGVGPDARNPSHITGGVGSG